MSYKEYKEVQAPKEVQDKFLEIQSGGDPKNPPTFGAAGLFDWLNKLSKEEGWNVVWPGFHFPFLVLEREVEEEVEK